MKPQDFKKINCRDFYDVLEKIKELEPDTYDFIVNYINTEHDKKEELFYWLEDEILDSYDSIVSNIHGDSLEQRIDQMNFCLDEGLLVQVF